MSGENFQALATIIGEVMSIDPDKVAPETTADDVDSWDSLNHLRLITAVEERFQIRLSMMEIMGLECVGDLFAAVESKVATP
ncbi:acyl carrier protein [Wenzhouxiangella sp. XN24]|uniref:acyl carrier protein n=1 Tax=Wenzhouxiangella sp. XN24 TaxID=2713569 RepID=UPI0013ED3E1E|nr:acyl carrier protein [Wenzhouxiangella sp. XN24]NGX16859.1 acyl carrier protein [Wenzhouxiangella sp. XN24]